jgi:hypothetical protein
MVVDMREIGRIIRKKGKVDIIILMVVEDMKEI